MEQKTVSPFVSSITPSFHSTEIQIPVERQVGFWRHEPVFEQNGAHDVSSMTCNGTIGSALKLDSLKNSQTCPIKEQEIMSGRNTIEQKLTASWKTIEQKLSAQRNSCVSPITVRTRGNKVDLSGTECETGLFSSSLSETFQKKLRVSSGDDAFGHSISTAVVQFEDNDPFASLEEMEAQILGNLLPGDDELFSGCVAQTNSTDEIEDFDLFSSIGGLELEGENGLGYYGNKNGADLVFSISTGQQLTSNGPIAGEHPFGEHLSRTLFDNPSDKDVNQGTLVAFNLDSSVSNDDLRHIFGAYGEIKEIRETPHKQNHKFIEFYDVRAAEAALRELNKCDIAGKRIKLEPSRPGGARRLMQQLSQDLELDEVNLLRQQGSPSNNSPLSYYGSHSSMSLPISCNDNGATKDHNSASCPMGNQFVNSASRSFSPASMIPGVSLPRRVPSIHSTVSHSAFVEANHSLGQMNCFHGLRGFHPHSLPEYHIMGNSIPYSSPNTISTMTANIFPRHAEGLPGRTTHSIGPNGFQNHSFKNGNGCCAMDGHHLTWSNPNSYQARAPSQMIWPNPTSFISGVPAPHPPHLHGFSSAHGNLVNTGLPSYHHHVGSAPTPILRPVEVSSNMFPLIGRNALDPSISAAGVVGLSSSNHRYQTFSHRDFMNSASPLFGSPSERFRGRRTDPSNHVDSKKLYELDVDRILHGEDTRTTLMIKNIPNKYTSKMLLAAIDEHHKGTYDFIYLPIDFKNKCNVGYAFVNMIDALHIVPFYETFNGKKWEKFYSEKVASLAYARIQGKASLIAHFQNSSLMNEDKRCRPILFHTDGPNAGDQEPFPVGLNVRTRLGKPRPSTFDDSQASPSSSPPTEEASFNLTNPSAGLTKEREPITPATNLN